MVISAAYRGYQLAKRVYSYGKPVITGKSFVSKFPPQHRQTVRTILKAGEIAFTGGLISDLIKDYNSQNFGVPDSAIPPKVPTGYNNKFRKKRSGYKQRPGRFNRYGSVHCRKMCGCYNKRR